MYDLLKSGQRIDRDWGPVHDAAFDKVKLLLTSKPFLHLPDYGPNAGQSELQTDASGRGIGAAILQYPRRDRGPGDKPRVVAYRSRGLRGAERWHDAGKRECLGLVETVEWFRHYVLGTDFALRTDHSNLTWLLQSAHARDPQYARWKAVLSDYAFDLTYDKDVAVADALSRNPRWADVRHKATRADMTHNNTQVQKLWHGPAALSGNAATARAKGQRTPPRSPPHSPARPWRGRWA